MFGLRSPARLALSIGVTAATILWLAAAVGIVPSPVKPNISARVEYSKLVAHQTTLAVENDQIDALQELLARAIQDSPNLVSAGLRLDSGDYLVDLSEHSTHWDATKNHGMCKVSISILAHDRPFGELQLLYRPIRGSELSDMWYYPLSMVFFIGGVVYLVAWGMLNRTFQVLQPGKIVPTRVRSALNSLAEGLVLLNQDGDIVHANSAFGDLVHQDPARLVGSRLNHFNWSLVDGTESDELPWQACLAKKQSISGSIVELFQRGTHSRYMVNASTILGEEGELRGILVSFDDITAMETKKVELASMIQSLRQSHTEVERQNEQLQFLASCDPLTRCFNRRSFWNHYEELWRTTDRKLLNIVMVDVDNFKSVNDTHGHSMGDEVLRETGALLRHHIGDLGWVCRYGGEEFAILLPNLELERAVELTWKLHGKFQNATLAGLKITASFGVSNGGLGAEDLQDLLDQADRCLYAAKRQGRNTVVRFDQCGDITIRKADRENLSRNHSPPIEYSAVTGLLSALAFRCKETAEHSIRVADLAVAIGKTLLNKRDLYRLEVCALLHDIGKIGVPDAILQKPDKLTEDEWEIMRRHDEIGVEIVRSAFASDEVAEIIQSYHLNQSGQGKRPAQPIDHNQLRLESRIIIACDALDSMICDSVYRRGMAIEDAIDELQRCTPSQFDPGVVELLVEYIKSPAFQANYISRVAVPARSAAAIGKHLEALYDAVANENIQHLRQVVEAIRHDRDLSQVDQINETAERLSQAIQCEYDHPEQIFDLANEMVQLCRSTRASFLDRADQVNGAGPLRSE